MRPAQPVHVGELRPHEATEEELLQKLVTELKRGLVIQEPIVIDQATRVILDGHHRHAAYKILGLEYVSCLLVDYRSTHIRVEARRPGIFVSKEEVIRRGLTGDLYPPKTTRHTFDVLQKTCDP
ncbi:MAG: hypothetical protein A2Z21_01485 [Candidatus Fraserbacteria bacterium RBG_16_55_9]|uniref:ParB-like N-terminal domain-containing protein n=1 Tax=Fraserbacteria sp. (strain RBG_16_55_9) TaxID=1817864 RepID=A0A1F5UWW4_FRAXR|nr:MAG: hypothetical protein A2Z21_01485 [Candidatus Fraserbacteria bacterium RBG_16_55_9]